MILHPGPGSVVFSGAGLLWQRAAHAAGPPPPLPGGIAAVLRLLFNLPPWLQISGAVVGGTAAAGVLTLLWKRRAALLAWLLSRQRGVKLALAAGAAAVALGAGGAGGAGWHYMQHDNGFCTGCHVMGPAFQRFTQSEHDTLECHQCHQQSMFASMRQLYLWVAERPQQIGPHAKVPNRVCAGCHVTGQREVWQRIASTAGHRTHLESDSAALKNVQCVTCHGLEVHRFAPVDSTCAQAGCHVSVRIQLGKMARQTSLHCVACHRFTAEVPALATRDSARGTLVPAQKQCFACHEMRTRLADYDPGRDPHGGTCGMCHNPHAQRTTAEAATRCASAGCHADWRKVPFHVGLRHRRVERCITCHEPHQARIDASDCAGCHAAVAARARGTRLAPPLPFDTLRALRSSTLEKVTDGKHGRLSAWPPRSPPRRHVAGRGSAAPADSFPHARHRSLTCLTCHTSEREHGRLTFEAPRGCQICHHQAPAAARCGACHADSELVAPRQATVRVAVSGRPARERGVAFSHGAHRDVRCVACHATPVTLDPAPDAAHCVACHDGHHAAARDCAACHGGPPTRQAHARPVEAHESCDACHAPATVARLTPDRALCVLCHAEQREHYRARECTTCHFLASPEAYRAHLMRGRLP